MANYLWFAEADVEESQDALLVSADNFLGVDPADGGLKVFFKDLEGNEAARETVTLSCTNGNQKAVAAALARIMAAHPHSKGAPIVVADFNVANSQGAIGANKEFGGLVTAVTIT